MLYIKNESTSNNDIEVNHKNICKKLDFKVLLKGKRLINSGYLNHVIQAFQHQGFKIIQDSQQKWNILWHHDFPFIDEQIVFSNFLDFIKINHFPGSGYLTNKANLMRMQDKSILERRPNFLPEAFTLPKQLQQYIQHINFENLTATTNASINLWVLKSKDHRGVQIVAPSQVISQFRDRNETGADAEDFFVQKYIANPLLIDGKRFDIGIYTLITSLHPLRLYIYWGDVLLRFCSKSYFPFNPSNTDQYVISDDYTPLWKIPSLSKYYVEQGTTFKTAFDIYVRDQLLLRSLTSLKQPIGAAAANADKTAESVIWEPLKRIIRQVVLNKRAEMMAADTEWRHYLHFPLDSDGVVQFFELVRFDFILDDEYNPYLMEVNMSPNLDSHHFPPNSRLYLRLLHDTVALVTSDIKLLFMQRPSGNDISINNKQTINKGGDKYLPEISVRDLAVFPTYCQKYCGTTNSTSIYHPQGVCPILCFDKVNDDDYYNSPFTKMAASAGTHDYRNPNQFLIRSYLEHLNRHNFIRLYPPQSNYEYISSHTSDYVFYDNIANLTERIFAKYSRTPLPNAIETKVNFKTNTDDLLNESSLITPRLPSFLLDLDLDKLNLDHLLALWFETKCLISSVELNGRDGGDHQTFCCV